MAKTGEKVPALFDPRKPFELNGFQFTRKGVRVPRGTDPSFGAFHGTVDFVIRVHKASGFWLVDLIKYADSRPEWEDKVDQLIDADVITEKTLKQYRYLGKHMLDEEERIEGVGFGKHAIVAAMAPESQREWLEKAKDQGWNTADLKDEIRASERVKIIDGQAKLEGMFRIIYADPPWLYGDSGATLDGSLGKAERSYKGMTIEQLCALPVKAHALPDSLLAMWVTAPLLLQNPGPRDVLEAWGFTYKSNYVWDKVLGMRGNYNHVVHEHLVIATRGSCLMDVPTPQPKSVQTIRRGADWQHSQKPDEFRSILEKHWTRGPYLELFGRKRVPGWEVFGNDARLWTQKELPAPADVDLDTVPF